MNFTFNKKIVLWVGGVIISLALIAGIFYTGFWFGKKQIYFVAQPNSVDFSLFWDAYDKLSKNFVSPEKIDNKKIIYGAIEGMAQSLGDPYTTFFNPDQAKRFQQDLSGSFEGIGAQIGIKKNLLTIIAPLDGTPAFKAGLKSGDIISKIDGKDTTDMTTDEAVTLIRGKKGTEVTLAIFRTDWKSTKEYKITRDTIIVTPIKWSLKNGETAYIKITEFDETLPDDFKKVALEILQSNAKNIIIDLRDNPGGYLEVAQNIAGWFLPTGKTVTIEDFGKAKEQQIYKTQGGAQLLNYPVVILMNQGSASASEILAGTLRDNRNIKLIGTKSFGKGSVQQVVTLPDSSFLKITIAKWLTPKGSSIAEVGLSPDIKVELTEKDTEQNKDPQLDKALEIVKTLK